MKPILMTTEMVKAIFEDRKTQTRRVIKPQPEKCKGSAGESIGVFTPLYKMPYGIDITEERMICKTIKEYDVCPYGKVGNRLWVRETWCDPNNEGLNVFYKADFPYYYNNQHGDRVKMEVDELKWKPSIFMPKNYSRITLEITDIRVEKIKDTSEDDCMLEGIDMETDHASLCINIEDCTAYENDLIDGSAIKTVFSKLWDKINRKRGYGWGVNPWVWVIEFKQIKK